MSSRQIRAHRWRRWRSAQAAHGDSVRTSMISLALLILCIPLAAAVTIALLPMWSWLEARSDIESVGHSGPADWCYGVVYAGCVIVIGTGVLWGRRRTK